MKNRIPETHFDLLTSPYHGIFTTMMLDGMPQSSMVWCDWDGKHIIVNTTKERQKGKNILKNSKVSLIIIDPKDSGRWISIQGEVEIETEGALEHLDRVTQKYTEYKHYYGNIYPKEQKERETRIICKIKPINVIVDAIHK